MLLSLSKKSLIAYLQAYLINKYPIFYVVNNVADLLNFYYHDLSKEILAVFALKQMIADTSDCSNAALFYWFQYENIPKELKDYNFLSL